MKRRYFAAVLMLAMLLSGCGNAVSGTIETKPEVNKTPESTVIPAEREMPVSMGRLEGGTYINDYAGFACELDGNWTYLGAEELQDMPENVREMIEGSELGDQLDTMNQFTDMLAENVDQMATINVLYQKHTMQERLAYAVMDETQIMDSLLEMQDKLIEAYNQAGYAVDSMEKVTVSFLGEERVALHTAMHMQDVPYYTLQLFDYHLGQYSVTLTLASFVEDNTESLLELFSKVE